MKKLSRLLIAVFIPLASPVVGFTQSVAALKPEDFAIVDARLAHSIALREPIDAVISQLGSPSNVTIEKSSPPSESSWDVIDLEFANLKIGYLRNWRRVRFIESKSAEYRSTRGVAIGDSEEKVLRTYGPPSAKSNADIYYLDVPSKDEPTGKETYAIGFVIEDRKVRAILVNITAD